MQNSQIAGKPLETIIPSIYGDIYVAGVMTYGMVKTNSIGQSAAKILNLYSNKIIQIKNNVQRLNGSW